MAFKAILSQGHVPKKSQTFSTEFLTKLWSTLINKLIVLLPLKNSKQQLLIVSPQHLESEMGKYCTTHKIFAYCPLKGL